MNVGARTRRRRSHAYNIMYDKSPRSALVVVSYIYITIYEFLYIYVRERAVLGTADALWKSGEQEACLTALTLS